jgi:predicted alpha/beta superfamily hydrolase
VDILYKTGTTLRRTVRIAYPPGRGRITLRTEVDWDRDLEPQEVNPDGTVSTFVVQAKRPFLYFKTCLQTAGECKWSVGSNQLLLMSEPDRRVFYPFFDAADHGRFTQLLTFPSAVLGREHRLRVYLPPGYEENTLATYPLAFMQDGQNLFFPEEAFLGSEWSVDETSQTLHTMRAAEDFIIIGIHSGDRMQEYTRPGYEAYARSLATEIVPEAQKRLRLIDDRRARSVWGSSLGGVVSFFSVWEYPEVFGAAVCMSSTFSFKDDLIERVLGEPRRQVGFYLDSGWPGDNYEVTMAMATALIARGWRFGHDLMHLCFPQAAHNESAWGTRLHLPLQFLNGAVARASRAIHPVLGDTPLEDDVVAQTPK